MKNILALLSVVLMAGCMVALAEDNTTANNPQDAAQTAQQHSDNMANDTMNQAGTAADNAQDNAQTTTETVKKSTTQAKNAKTCIDDNGNTLKKGEAGFKTCIKHQMKEQESGQAPGTMGTDESTVKSHSDESKTNDNNG